MKRTWIRLAIILAWAGTTFWLVRYKAFPEYFSHALAGYSGFLSRDVLVADSWMRVLLNDTPIGYSHTSMDMDDADFASQYSLRSVLHIRMNLMGAVQDIDTSMDATLNGLQELQSFKVRMNAMPYRMTLAGRRAGKSSFLVAISTPTSTQKRKVDIPEDVILYSPMMEIAMKRLKPGQEVTVRTLDPISLAPTLLKIKALRRETITLHGQPYDALLLSSDNNGVTVMTWLDSEGDAIRQETPFGWSLERCTADEAYQALRESRGGADVLNGMAVKLEGSIRDPRGCDAVQLRLQGVPFGPTELATPRQQVLSADTNSVELKVCRESPAGPDEPDAAVAELLKPTPALQSDHAEIVALAREITAKATTPVERAFLIHDWVHDNLRKTMTVSVPSALDVLRSREGDCNEHTYLAVALARAAGLPAKVMVGIAYQNGRFYYHAWPAVFVGRWMEMDPTWGQRTVDATHIALVQGELSEQVKLLRIIGQLKMTLVNEVQAGGEKTKHD